MTNPATITRRQLTGALELLEADCALGTFQPSAGPARFGEIADYIFARIGK